MEPPQAQQGSAPQQPDGDAASAPDAPGQPVKHEELRHAEPGSATTRDASSAQQAPPAGGSSDQFAAPSWRPPHAGLPGQPHAGLPGALPHGMPESVSPGSTESSHLAMQAPLQMPMAESRQEEEFLMTFASPHGMAPGPPGMGGPGMMGAPGPHTPLPQQHGQESMQSLMHQSMYPEAGMQMQAGGYGGSPAVARPGPSFARMGAPPPQPAGQAARADGSPHVPPHLQQQEELRDPGRLSAPPASSAAHLPRSASEGVMRASAGSHARTRSGGAAGRGPPGAGRGQPRPLDSPDFAMIYAFLGSMFDPVCHMINHADVMQQMTPVDRETAALILANCVHNFGTPGFTEELLAQLRAPKQARRGGLGGGPGGYAGGAPQPEQPGGLP